MAASTSSSYSDEDAVLSDINVTPLVDVVLVLLIVFMITVPAIVGTAPIQVELPETTAAAVASAAERLPLEIYLRKESSGQIGLYVGDRAVDLAGLERTVAALGKNKSEQEVKIAADKGIPYGEVIKVMDTLVSLGLNKLSLDTKPIGAR